MQKLYFDQNFYDKLLLLGKFSNFLLVYWHTTCCFGVEVLVGEGHLTPVHTSGHARRANTVPITHSNTQGEKGNGRHERN